MNSPISFPGTVLRPGEAGNDAAHDREAARLRAEHAGWVVIWLPRGNCFNAYKRMPGARHDTALSAPTAPDMAGKIREAEKGRGRAR
jgi:hypothetical protein